MYEEQKEIPKVCFLCNSLLKAKIFCVSLVNKI